DCAAVELARLKRMNLQIPARSVQVVGRNGQVAFVGSEPRPGQPSNDAMHRVSLDGRLWLIGRVRLDAREELASSRQGAAFAQESDAFLCLRAYKRWGEQCLER